MPRRISKPSYTLHKPSGQARVRINGTDHYLGPYGSPESREAYDDLIAEWLVRNGDTARYTLRVDDLCLLYLEHAERHYRKDGKPTSEVACIRSALRHVVKVHGPTRVRDFGPKALKAVRRSMVESGYVRTSINIHVNRIRSMFRWAVAEELVPGAVLTALQAVAGLRAGRGEAVEAEPVKPVGRAAIDAVKPHVSRPVWAMIQLQLLTGMRPGEVLVMRGCDLNMSGKVWEYVPRSHKTEHHDKGRMILIGPKAQRVLRPFLKTDLQAFLFCPRDVREAVDGRDRQPGERYDRSAYRNAVMRACERAFGMPDDLRRPKAAVWKLRKELTDKPAEFFVAELKRLQKLAAEWRREHCWHPHQLRHNTGTTIRREAGAEVARTVLGHSKLSTTEIYAEQDVAKARKIIGRVG